MLPWDTAFVMFLLAIGYRRIPEMERLSISIVAILLTLVALAIRAPLEVVLDGGTLGFGGNIWLVWSMVIFGLCVLTFLEDRKNPPERPTKEET